ncbi:MAG: CPBP family intramembrane glutamic endopeptidase [Thermoplasmatota archaeon]
MWVLLAVDLVAIAALLLSNIYGGAVLLLNPESEQAQQLREQMEGGSAWDTYLNLGLSFLLFGVIPLAWLLGTRRRPWHGARKYLQLDCHRRDWIRGLLLVPALLAAVFVLTALYLVATEGIEALQGGGERSVDAMFGDLTWPLVVFIALASGIGEEIFFRGILRRWIGVWMQGIIFGVAHAGGAYPPQILFAFGLGVLFGCLMRRGWSLVTMMVGHAGYNFTLLALAMALPEAI